MSIRRSWAAALVALVLVAAPTSAQVVYNNGSPDGQAGSDIFNDFRAADDFTVSTSLAFDLVRFWALLPAGSTYAPSIFWQILTDGGGVPSPTVVASGTVVAASTLRASFPFGFDSYQLDLSIGPQLLSPGVFWLALHDGQLGDITDSSLLWEMPGNQSGAQFAVDFIPANQWTGDWGGDLAFELHSRPVSAVPEPATLALVATGVAGVAGFRRRQRKGPLLSDENLDSTTLRRAHHGTG
jgi:hypothetical protein